MLMTADIGIYDVLRQMAGAYFFTDYQYITMRALYTFDGRAFMINSAPASQ